MTLENVLIPVARVPDPTAAVDMARRAAAVMSDEPATITLTDAQAELLVGKGK